MSTARGFFSRHGEDGHAPGVLGLIFFVISEKTVVRSQQDHKSL